MKSEYTPFESVEEYVGLQPLTTRISPGSLVITGGIGGSGYGSTTYPMSRSITIECPLESELEGLKAQIAFLQGAVQALQAEIESLKSPSVPETKSVSCLKCGGRCKEICLG